MTPEQKEKYTEGIVAGVLPEQDFFTPEEVKHLVQIALTWSAEQIRFEIGEMVHKDIESYMRVCQFENTHQAIQETEEYFSDNLEELAEFVHTWI